MKIITLILFTLAILFLTNCTRSTVHVNPPTSAVALTSPVKSQWAHTFVVGIFPTYQIDAAKYCGSSSKVVKIDNKIGFWNGVLTGITYGLYTPRTIDIYCNR